MSFQGKTIILGVPKQHNLDQFIQKELEKLGFQVINISFFDNAYTYKNVWQRVHNFIQKNLKGDKFHKTKLKFRLNEQSLRSRLADVDTADYSLIIRPDTYSIDFLKLVKSKSKIISAYQWDGINRFPDVQSRVSIFDRFFVFDPQDVQIPRLLPITNFHTIDNTPEEPLIKNDIYFAGAYTKNRLEILKEIYSYAENTHLKANFLLFSKKEPISYFGTSTKPISYETNLINSRKSACIIDIHNPIHSGLSFRTFESLALKTKLITTNQEIKKYDFYSRNNIFIWGLDSPENLLTFLSTDYQKIPTEIIEKYNFANWIRYILDEQPYTSLNLPI